MEPREPVVTEAEASQLDVAFLPLNIKNQTLNIQLRPASGTLKKVRLSPHGEKRPSGRGEELAMLVVKNCSCEQW